VLNHCGLLGAPAAGWPECGASRHNRLGRLPWVVKSTFQPPIGPGRQGGRTTCLEDVSPPIVAPSVGSERHRKFRHPLFFDLLSRRARPLCGKYFWAITFRGDLAPSLRATSTFIECENHLTRQIAISEAVLTKSSSAYASWGPGLPVNFLSIFNKCRPNFQTPQPAA